MPTAGISIFAAVNAGTDLLIQVQKNNMGYVA
jgi:hypothetical protein